VELIKLVHHLTLKNGFMIPPTLFEDPFGIAVFLFVLIPIARLSLQLAKALKDKDKEH